MAGYIMSLKKPTSNKVPITKPLAECILKGVYSTKLSQPTNNKWMTHHEATIADYATMKEGDNIYFFINRRIYGIGTLKNIDSDCKFNNYVDASKPASPKYKDIKETLLVDFGEESADNRWVCLFEPNPYFFTEGVDMDDVLASNPSKFRMIRAFSKLSFIKIDDEENKALRDIILMHNEDCLNNPNPKSIFHVDDTIHNQITSKLKQNNYKLNISDIITSCSNWNSLEHEMALEAGTLYQLANNDENTINTFGEWDYISHQVIASPFKPLEYVDKMDMFGYRYINGFKGTISKYLIIELKKGPALVEDIEQVMKYVDWINQEYSFGNYSMINAFLVAKSINEDVINARDSLAKRNFLIGRRPAKSSIWCNLKLVEYDFDSSTNSLKYKII